MEGEAEKTSQDQDDTEITFDKMANSFHEIVMEYKVTFTQLTKTQHISVSYTERVLRQKLDTDKGSAGWHP